MRHKIDSEFDYEVSRGTNLQNFPHIRQITPVQPLFMSVVAIAFFVTGGSPLGQYLQYFELLIEWIAVEGHINGYPTAAAIAAAANSTATAEKPWRSVRGFE